ncbi:hypothetical protein SK128_024091 [Halocaridina rubra]|uniref:Uncharacterized protein n=1 Tax=Halocaridina rubra TaxID=373956 RepID=A0AAN8XDD3_HALRR
MSSLESLPILSNKFPRKIYFIENILGRHNCPAISRGQTMDTVLVIYKISQTTVLPE